MNTVKFTDCRIRKEGKKKSTALISSDFKEVILWQ